MYYLKYDETDLTLLFFSGPGVFLPFRPFLQFIKMFLKKSTNGLINPFVMEVNHSGRIVCLKKPKSPKVITSNMQRNGSFLNACHFQMTPLI